MTREQHGTIIFFLQSPPKNNHIDNCFERKILEILVTTKLFPMLVLDNKAQININGAHVLKGYDHISIPPDLRIHLTSNTNDKKHLFSNLTLVDNSSGLLTDEHFHLFTFITKPLRAFERFQGKVERHQAEIISLPNNFDDDASLYIDFFVHSRRDENLKDLINNISIPRQPKYEIGSYEFKEVLRGKFSINPNFYFTIVFGYVDSKSNEDECFNIFITLVNIILTILVV